MPTRYVPTGQPRHRQAPGPKPETVTLIAQVRAAMADGVRRHELPRVLDVSPGRVSNALMYISRWDGGTPQPGGAAPLPRPAGWGWQERASCRGMDLYVFFGPEGERQPERERREKRAKAVCAGCPVRTECLDYAVGRPEKYGTWAGLNEDERADERRKRLRAACEQRKAAS